MKDSKHADGQDTPVQPVDKPIICSPYVEPQDHWLYDQDTGAARRAGYRRLAGYWYKDEQAGAAQMTLTGMRQEQREDMPLVNLLREEVRRWREAKYRGRSDATGALLRHWAREDRERPLFFCQREAVETIIYLAELRIPGKSSKTGFRNFPLDEDSLQKMLRGEKPDLRSDQRIADGVGFYPTLVDLPYNNNLLPLRRMGCKMATGSGKTVRPCRATFRSHVNQVVLDAPQWEATAAFFLEQAAQRKLISHYVRNDHLGLLIPYEFQGLTHTYEPDFVVCLREGQYLLLEIKGQEDEQDRAKHGAANKWVRAVNHWGQLGTWRFRVSPAPQKLPSLLQSLAALPRSVIQ